MKNLRVNTDLGIPHAVLDGDTIWRVDNHVACNALYSESIMLWIVLGAYCTVVPKGGIRADTCLTGI